MSTTRPPGTEHGSRSAFLARARGFAARGTGDNIAHPLPPAGEDASGHVPIAYRLLDDADLVGSFERNAMATLLNIHRVGPAVSDEFLSALMIDAGISTAVVSAEPLAQEVGRQLTRLGVDVRAYDREAAAEADLGVTAPFAAVAGTGSLVQDSTLEGARGVSLLPRLHLAVLPATRIVATTADVLVPLSTNPPPANLVFITGPSRTGDIEMILTVGVHGPIAVHVCVLEPAGHPA